MRQARVHILLILGSACREPGTKATDTSEPPPVTVVEGDSSAEDLLALTADLVRSEDCNVVYSDPSEHYRERWDSAESTVNVKHVYWPAPCCPDAVEVAAVANLTTWTIEATYTACEEEGVRDDLVTVEYRLHGVPSGSWTIRAGDADELAAGPSDPGWDVYGEFEVP